MATIPNCNSQLFTRLYRDYKRVRKKRGQQARNSTIVALSEYDDGVAFLPQLLSVSDMICDLYRNLQSSCNNSCLTIPSRQFGENVRTNNSCLTITSRQFRENVRTSNSCLTIPSRQFGENVRTNNSCLTIPSRQFRENVRTNNSCLTIPSRQFGENVRTNNSCLTIPSREFRENVRTNNSCLTIPSRQFRENVRTNNSSLAFTSLSACYCSWVCSWVLDICCQNKARTHSSANCIQCSQVAEAHICGKCADSGNNNFFAFFNSSWRVDETVHEWELVIGLVFPKSKIAAKIADTYNIYLNIIYFVLDTVE